MAFCNKQQAAAAAPAPAPAPAASDQQLDALLVASLNLRKALVGDGRGAGGAGGGTNRATLIAAGRSSRSRGKQVASTVDLFQDAQLPAAQSASAAGGGGGAPLKTARELAVVAEEAFVAAHVALPATDATSWQPLIDVARFICYRCLNEGERPDWRNYTKYGALLPCPRRTRPLSPSSLLPLIAGTLQPPPRTLRRCWC